MEYFSKQLKKLRDEMFLDPRKKAAGRAELLSYMRATRAVRAQELERQSIMKRSPIFTNKKAMQFAAIIAVLAILSGGVSFAADRALPGDALYAVKVNVNEEVRAALALSANAKAKLNAQLAAERLKEATALAAEGRLNAETEAELRSSFQASANEAQVQIQALKLSGKANIAAEINEDFVSNLEAQARAMAAVSGSAATTAAASAGALVDLATTVNSILDASVDSEIQL